MALNFVTAGSYKGGVIKIKGLKRKVVLNTSFPFYLSIELNKKNVDRIEIIEQSKGTAGFLNYSKAQIAIYFKNGKKSLAEVDPEIYKRLNELLF